MTGIKLENRRFYLRMELLHILIMEITKVHEERLNVHEACTDNL